MGASTVLYVHSRLWRYWCWFCRLVPIACDFRVLGVRNVVAESLGSSKSLLSFCATLRLKRLHDTVGCCLPIRRSVTIFSCFENILRISSCHKSKLNFKCSSRLCLCVNYSDHLVLPVRSALGFTDKSTSQVRVPPRRILPKFRRLVMSYGLKCCDYRWNATHYITCMVAC